MKSIIIRIGGRREGARGRDRTFVLVRILFGFDQPLPEFDARIASRFSFQIQTLHNYSLGFTQSFHYFFIFFFLFLVHFISSLKLGEKWSIYRSNWSIIAFGWKEGTENNKLQFVVVRAENKSYTYIYGYILQA